MPHQTDKAEPAALSVRVERSGGFAGLTRHWRVDAAPDDAAAWFTLVDRCPWSPLERATPRGADRFSWTVSAHCGRERRHAELADHEVDGAWKELIDAVRGAADASAGATTEE